MSHTPNTNKKIKEATSYKPQASSAKLIEMIDTSVKPQAASFKLQAASDKLRDLCALIKFHVARSEVLR